VHGARDVLLQTALEEHAYNHRLFRAFRCSARCRACDMWATLWLGVKATGPSRDWPIRPLLKPLIEEATGYAIKDPLGFSDQVVRDLARLPAVRVTPWRKRSIAERRLAATYNVTSRLPASSNQHVPIGAGDIEKK
jgi:hypothetical protein